MPKSHMPKSLRKESNSKQPTEKQYLKRRTVEAGIKLAEDAHATVWRLYNDVFGFWRICRKKPCRRNRRCCTGEPARCLMVGLTSVPPAERPKAQKDVIAGGPRRIPPKNHMEYLVRRQPLHALTGWPGAAPGKS